MNIHLPAILGFTRYQGFDPSPFQTNPDLNPPNLGPIFITSKVCPAGSCWQPRSMQTPITIVNPVMGVWPKDAPDQQEEITMKFVAGTDARADWRMDRFDHSHYMFSL